MRRVHRNIIISFGIMTLCAATGTLTMLIQFFRLSITLKNIGWILLAGLKNILFRRKLPQWLMLAAAAAICLNAWKKL